MDVHLEEKRKWDAADEYYLLRDSEVLAEKLFEEREAERERKALRCGQGLTAEEKKRLWDEMQLAAEELYHLDEEAQQRRRELKERIVIGLLRIAPRWEDAVTQFWASGMERYDPHKGPFRNYAEFILKRRAITLWHKEKGHRRRWVYNPATGENEQIWDCGEITASQREEDQQTKAWLENLPGDASAEEQTIATIEGDRIAQQLISLILQLPDKLYGKQKNPDRILYFRLFFTDGAVASIYAAGTAPYQAHERDLFQAMRLPFLDFFLRTQCRTLQAVMRTRLKPYGEMVEGRGGQEPGQPLPNDVYRAYLESGEGKRVGDSALSNQRKAYQIFLHDNLC